MKQARKEEKMMMKKMLTAGFFTTIMLIASFTALAGSNISLTSRPEAYESSIQPISENGELGNVTIYGYVRAWVRGPYGLQHIIPIPNAEVIVWSKPGSSYHFEVETETNDQGHYACSVRQRQDYRVYVKVWGEDDELLGITYKDIHVSFWDKRVSFILWRLGQQSSSSSQTQKICT
jgi:hypothetical protein